MSLIGLGILAALATAAATGGAIWTRRKLMHRTPEQPPALPAAGAAADAVAAAADAARRQLGPPLMVGDVVQCGDATRWPQGALRASDHEGVRLVILLSEENGERQATVAFAQPERSLLWLRATDEPAQRPPPSRIEIERLLLDRSMLLSLSVRSEGDAPKLAGDATVAIYDGAIGEAALLLDHPDLCALWFGKRVARDDWERLANVPDPEDAP